MLPGSCLLRRAFKGSTRVSEASGEAGEARCDALFRAVEDGLEAVGGRLRPDVHPGKVLVEEVSNEGGLAGGIRADQQHQRLRRQRMRQGAPQSFPLAVHLASKCTKPAAASAEYSPTSVLATPSTTTAMEATPLQLPASAQPGHAKPKPLHREEDALAQKTQDSLEVCEGGCGLAVF